MHPNLRSIADEVQLEEVLSEPYPEDIDTARRLGGDVLILGAGGKMGPTLARRIQRALRQAGRNRKVIAVSRFSHDIDRERLEASGVTCISADLHNESDLLHLPDCPFVLFLAGAKFGMTGQEELLWVTNTYLPGRVAERFCDSVIVALSTGNVYPLVPIASGGCRETDPVGPIGEYAQSCLGRERVLTYFSVHNKTPILLLRLNYAVEARYGVLVDIALNVHQRLPVNLKMGYFNAIWQGDANSVCLRSLELACSPAKVLNLTGRGVHSVRAMAEEFSQRFGIKPIFEGEESETALLSNAELCHRRFGMPRIEIQEVVDLVSSWVDKGGPLLHKPTHFEVRDGRF